MNVHPSQLRTLFEQVLPKWPYSDLAMFCLYISRITGTLTAEALEHMLRISDTDLIRQTNLKMRASLLSSWVETYIRVKLEQWPPA